MNDTSHPFAETATRMPALFIGHGSPMNAIEDNEFSRAWIELGPTLPRPAAILCISAHWETNGTYVTAMARPRTIHDFGGFPPALYQASYAAPGSPDLAQMVQALVADPPVAADHAWGLDHGAWSVLCRLFPQADIPVVQLSLNRRLTPQGHYDLGRQLAPLRRRGVLIIGSGNLVHNLGIMRWEDQAYDWAEAFDQTAARLIAARDHAPLINYGTLGQAARLAIPTEEHYLPLLYILALQEDAEPLHFFTERVTLGAISMRSLRIG